VLRIPENDFSRLSVLVVGDVMLDRYIIGEAHRISPEAPVPVVEVRAEKQTAGGAGNVALNLAGLRAKTSLTSITGNDSLGAALAGILREHGIDTSGLITCDDRPTSTKTRVMCGNHQLLRFDHESLAEISLELCGRVERRISEVLDGGIDLVILSDYAKGLLTPPLLKSVIGECLERGLLVFVDPKRADYAVYSGATCLTPNLKEFDSAVTAMAIPGADFAQRGQALRQKLDSPLLLVTKGSEGMTLFSDNGVLHLPALAQEVFDVSGAGDTVVATFALAVASGIPPGKAAELATFAASVVVRRVGTSPIVWQDLTLAD
jgi:rfaE bifunctional protein kinase chain/domain